MKESIFLEENKYIDFSESIIKEKVNELFRGLEDDIDKAKIAYEFVRDEIPHSFDIKAKVVTVKASDVLKYKTGICHAKANLLAALLRKEGIPTGFCFQHITLLDDDSLGYCVHCYNAILINNKWIKVDARGNTNGIKADFSLNNPKLAFENRNNYNEYFWEGIYSKPHNETMIMLEKSKVIEDVMRNIPDSISDKPDIS